jgi:hypothetical protein
MCNAVGVHQNADTGDLRRNLFEHIKQFSAQGRLHNRKAGDVAAWMCQARHQTIGDRIATGDEDDGTVWVDCCATFIAASPLASITSGT